MIRRIDAQQQKRAIANMFTGNSDYQMWKGKAVVKNNGFVFCE